MKFTEHAKIMLKLIDGRGVFDDHTVLGRVITNQYIKESTRENNIDPMHAFAPFGNWLIILESHAPQAPVRGLEPVSAERGHYCWRSANRYSENVARALVKALERRADVLQCYTLKTI